MASINYGAKEISVKIVYYGPGLSGKTTNLQVIHQKIPRENKSNMVSLATETDRTLFFDFLPLDLGKIKGFTTKFQLYTVPGQVYYNATRKLVLRGVDGVVFVVDSQPSKIDENIESLQNLLDNLAEYGYQIQNIPLVLQYNKRDVPDAVPIEQLQTLLNKNNYPYTEAVAIKGKGVFETLKYIGKMVIDELNRKYSRPSQAAVPPRPVSSQQRPPAASGRVAAAAPSVPPRPNMPTSAPPAYSAAPLKPPQATRPVQQPHQGAAAAEVPPPQRRPVQPPPPRPAAPAVASEPFDPFLDSQTHQNYSQPVAPASSAAAAQTTIPAIDIFATNSRPPIQPPPSQRQQATVPPPRQALSQGFTDYNIVDLSSGGAEDGQTSSRISPDETATAFPETQMPINKSELDLEIERYQREIEARQKQTLQQPSQKAWNESVDEQNFGQPATQQEQYDGAQSPSIEIYRPGSLPPSAQQHKPATSYESTIDSQDYDVYDLSSAHADSMPPSAGKATTPEQEASTNEDEQSPMFFTSVNTERTRRKIKRPINPKERATNKGILGKFFGKKDQNE